jgi:hypothetical protein
MPKLIGKITMATGGNGAPPHTSGELFRMMAGIDLLRVPYRGAAPALTDLLAGQVQVMFPTMPSAIEYVRTGSLRALAVTTSRSDALPDIPAVKEFVPGYEATTWYGIGAPKKTPPEIVERLNKETNAAIAEPKFKARRPPGRGGRASAPWVALLRARCERHAAEPPSPAMNSRRVIRLPRRRGRAGIRDPAPTAGRRASDRHRPILQQPPPAARGVGGAPRGAHNVSV